MSVIASAAFLEFDKRPFFSYDCFIMFTKISTPIAIAAAQGVRSINIVNIHGG